MRLLDQSPPADIVLREALAGLSRTPKELPAKFFYDAAGCALFEQICDTPEYYLTRAELQLMERHVGAIARFLGERARLIEFGSGSGRKTPILIEAARPALYVAVEIACEALRAAGAALEARFPGLPVIGVCADYMQPVVYPDLAPYGQGRLAVYFPGSTVGNFTLAQTAQFLREVRDLVGPGGALVIGVDLKKDPARLHAAYNDAAQITAAFNLNLLAHLNWRFGANFDLGAFQHVAFYDPAQGRIEMHLRALREHGVTLAGRRFRFEVGEAMRTEISCKYTIDEFQAMGRAAGFTPEQVWQDDEGLFAVFGFAAP